MAKKHNHDDDDFMNNRMNERLEEIEARITDIYTQASNEAQDTLNSYLERYSSQYNEMRQKRANNEITREEYNSWIQAHMLQNQRYTATVNQLTDMLVKTDKAAMAVLNGELPYVIAESYDFVQFVGSRISENTGLSVGSFQIYNARSVQALIRDNPDLLPRVNTREDTAWNRDHITREITQGILQGDSIPHVADRLQRVTNMDRSAAIRNARTAMTGAENLGRNESYQFMTEQGIEMVKLWSATYDDRTRESHLRLDGTKADKNGLFGVGIIDTPIQYPGDPAGDPEEIYNCRCRLDIVPPEYSREVTAANYDKWMQENFPDDYAALSEREDVEQSVKPEVAEIQVEPATEEVIPVMAEEAPAVEPVPDSAQTQTPIEDIIETDVENAREDVVPEPEVEHPTVDHQIRGVSKNADARTSWIEENLDFDRTEASEICDSVARYTAGDAYNAIHNNQTDMFPEDIQNIDALLNNPNMPIYDGVTYRGVHIDDSDGLSAMDKINAIISGGTWNEPGITSFTDDRRRANLFASGGAWGDKTQGVNVLIINRENLTGCPIQHLSACNRPEHEILVPSDIRDRGYEIVSSKVQQKVDIIEAYENEFHPELNHPERRLESTWVIIEVRENGR